MEINMKTLKLKIGSRKGNWEKKIQLVAIYATIQKQVIK